MTNTNTNISHTVLKAPSDLWVRRLWPVGSAALVLEGVCAVPLGNALLQSKDGPLRPEWACEVIRVSYLQAHHLTYRDAELLGYDTVEAAQAASTPVDSMSGMVTLVEIG